MDSPRISPEEIPRLDRLVKGRGVPMTLPVNEAIAVYLDQRPPVNQTASRSRSQRSRSGTSASDDAPRKGENDE